jgi:hypothetical protein
VERRWSRATPCSRVTGGLGRLLLSTLVTWPVDSPARVGERRSSLEPSWHPFTLPDSGSISGPYLRLYEQNRDTRESREDRTAVPEASNMISIAPFESQQIG